jgi:ketosteroid isomerase-like protein
MKTIADFAAAINSHDPDKIAVLMSDNHTFIDAHGNEMTGTETMKAGWASYFQLFPDYYIEIEEIVSKGDLATAYGYAGAGSGEKA